MSEQSVETYVEISESFIYHYLLEKECFKTAEKMLKERKKCASYPIKLKGKMTMTDVFSRLITGYKSCKISNAVVQNFLKNHRLPGVQKLATKMLEKLYKKNSPIEIQEKIPKIQDLLRHYLAHKKKKKISKPAKNKISNHLTVFQNTKKSKNDSFKFGSFDQNWDVDKYKSNIEPTHQWELRKKFLENNKGLFPEERLVGLGQVFANVEFMGCQYPKETMELVEELAFGIVQDHRERQKNRLQRTFVSGSDAANGKVNRSKKPKTS